MKTRTWKWIALVSCGAAVTQVAACAPMIVDLVLQQVLVTVIKGIISAAQAGAV